jgi:hypothetical protein
LSERKEIQNLKSDEIRNAVSPHSSPDIEILCILGTSSAR